MIENVLIEQFVKSFNMERLARDIISMIDKNIALKGVVIIPLSIF